MANHKQAAKRARQTIKRTLRNKHIRSTMRSYVKRVRTLVSEGNAGEAGEMLKHAVHHLDRSVTKGILHRRTASRLISRLTLSVNKLSSGNTEA